MILLVAANMRSRLEGVWYGGETPAADDPRAVALAPLPAEITEQVLPHLRPSHDRLPRRGVSGVSKNATSRGAPMTIGGSPGSLRSLRWRPPVERATADEQRFAVSRSSST